MNRKPYNSDIADEQRDVVELMLPMPKPRGRPPADLREIVDAIMYAARVLQEMGKGRNP